MLVTRFAPTPSGYLHAGNVVNALLTSWMSRAEHGRMLLRIDDFDAARLRPEYVADVFATVSWLGLPLAGGPRDAADFAQRFALPHLLDRITNARDAIAAAHADVVFVCRCSRRELIEGFCVRGCRSAGIALTPGDSALRAHVPRGVATTIHSLVAAPGRRRGVGVLAGARPLRAPVPPGDHVLWRREDLPAYHLASLVLDDDLGVTAIVRGRDLAASSALQVHLAALLQTPGPRWATYVHHDLVTAADGTKLSKSAGAQASPLTRDPDRLAALHELARGIGSPLGIAPPAG